MKTKLSITIATFLICTLLSSCSSIVGPLTHPSLNEGEPYATLVAGDGILIRRVNSNILQNDFLFSHSKIQVPTGQLSVGLRYRTVTSTGGIFTPRYTTTRTSNHRINFDAKASCTYEIQANAQRYVSVKPVSC